jgi:hypothetical protein
MSFLDIVELAAALLSAVLLVIGFQKNDRKILLAAWVCLLIASVLGSFVEGFGQGYGEVRGS